MNTNCDLLTIIFTPKTAFEVHPSRAVSRGAEDSELEKLKVRLLRQTLNESANTDAEGFIQRAADEAAALAWDTHFPLLVFPALFEEKARAAVEQMRRQISVRRRSMELLPECAARFRNLNKGDSRRPTLKP